MRKFQNRFFSFGVYKESLRRLRTVGIIFAAVMCFFSVSTYLTQMTANTIGSSSSYGGKVIVEVLSLSDMNIYPLLFLVAAPVMAFILFGYVNTRKASDFYHSLPYKRECVFFSGIAAIITWIVGILVLCSAVSVAAFSLNPEKFSVIYETIPVLMLSYIVTALLAAAVVSVAMSITGTVISNIVVALLLGFGPGLLSEVVISTIMDKTPYLVRSSFPFIFSGQHNLLYDSVANALIGGFNTMLWSAIAYSFVLALIYLAVAAVLFKTRDSESAHMPSAKPWLQHVYRIAFCLFLCLGSITNIVNYGIKSISPFIWLGFVVIIYFVYELVTTKKWSNVLRAVPGLFILGGLCVVLFCTMMFGGRVATLFEPEAEEIKYVRVLEQDNSSYYSMTSYYGNEEGFYSWASAKSSEIKIDDPEVKEIIARKIAVQNQRVIKDFAKEPSEVYTFVYAIKTSGGEKYRKLGISEGEYKILIEAMTEKEEYKNNFQILPDAKSVTVYSDINGDEKLTAQQYETLRSEIAEMDFAKWFTSLKVYSKGQDVITVNIVTDEGVNTKSIILNVDECTLPKTYKMLVEEKMFSDDALEQVTKSFDRAIGADYSANPNMYEINEISVDATAMFLDSDVGQYNTYVLNLWVSQEAGEVIYTTDENGNRTETVKENIGDDNQKNLELLKELNELLKSSDGEGSADSFVKIGYYVYIIGETDANQYNYRTVYIPIPEEAEAFFEQNATFISKAQVTE